MTRVLLAHVQCGCVRTCSGAIKGIPRPDKVTKKARQAADSKPQGPGLVRASEPYPDASLALGWEKWLVERHAASCGGEDSYEGRQGPTYLAGISTESVGSQPSACIC